MLCVRFASFISDFQTEHGYYPSRAKCAEVGGVTVEALAHFMKHERGVASLDQTMSEHNGSSGRTSGLQNLVYEEEADPAAKYGQDSFEWLNWSTLYIS